MEIPLFDPWLLRYVAYLHRESARLNGGAIAGHYLRCLRAACLAYQQSGDPEDRCRAWMAVRYVCQWLCQLDKGKGGDTTFTSRL
jgi:hypothetical protein